MSIGLDRKSEQKNVRDVQLVAFYLEEEEFAVEIQQVKEVLKLSKITPLPQALEFVEGVINLRGEIIPVIDLRKRFDLGAVEKNENNRIVIVEINGSDVGLIVDAVNEVVRLPEDCIHPAPADVAGARTDLIKAVGKKENRLIIMLDLESILSTEERISLEEVTLSGEETSTEKVE